MKDMLTTFGEAAEELGTTYAVISGLVEAHRITPKPVPRSVAKGLDGRDMATLRRALGLKRGEKVRKTASVPAPAH